MKLIVIYSTHPSMKEARRVAGELLQKKLIACVNYFPIESEYWWPDSAVKADGKGKIEKEKEIATFMKTTVSNWSKVQKEIKHLHSYDIPCIEKFSVESHAPYAQWVKKVVK